jgi:hypothetical protein
MGTSAFCGYFIFTVRFLLEPFLAGFYYFINHINIDLSEFPAKIWVNNRVQLTKNFSKFRVKMIFDAIIRPGLNRQYFPGIFWAMTDHLFPISLWYWMSSNSSSIVHYTLAVSVLMWF